MYNYHDAIKADILDYIRNNFPADEIAENLFSRDEWEEELHDNLWIDDGVTGNSSGSYYCNRWKAEESLAHNWDLLQNALDEFGSADINPIAKGAEWCDVTIRCYLLGECLSSVLDTLESKIGATLPF